MQKQPQQPSTPKRKQIIDKTQAIATSVYTKTETDTLLKAKASTTALGTNVPWVYDTFLQLDAIHTAILRPKKVGKTIAHSKVDANLAVVGTC